MPMQCEQFRLLSDSYFNNELLIEIKHDMVAHLKHCADCQHELVARREFRKRLRTAFRNAPTNQMTPDFVNRLNTELRECALAQREDLPVSSKQSLFSPNRQTVWLTLAACLLLATVITVVMVLHRLSSTYSRPQEIGQAQPTNSNSRLPRIDAPESNVQIELIRSAVGDHRDCAVHFRLTDKPIDLELAGRNNDPAFTNLTKAVLSQVDPGLDLRFVEAHSCVFKGRRFAHIVLKYEGRLVSFLVTDAVSATQTRENSPPTMFESQVISFSSFDGYQVAGLWTDRHSIFVVSDLSESENVTLARTLIRSAFAHITAIERAI